MKKQLLLIIACLFLSSSAYSWSFSEWFNEGITESMKKMEESFEEFKEEFSKVKFFQPQAISNYDKEKGVYFIQVELPGYEEKDFTIKANITDNQRHLTITAKQEKKENSFLEKKSFQMTKTIPQDAIIEKSSWSYKSGILRIEFPTDTKNIEVIEIKKSNQ